MRQFRSGHAAKIVTALLLFLAFAGLKTSPLLWQLNTHVVSDLGDPLLNTWILAWDFHALKTDPWNLFNANILYPLKNTLALSEHLLGVLPIFAPIYAITGNPILAYNVVLFLSFPLCGMSMFLLVYYWTRNFWAALISGCLFAFAPARFAQLSHLQLLNLYWSPIALIFLDRFLHGPNLMNLFGFSMFYWMQVLSSVYLGWLITIATVLYILGYFLFINKNVISLSTSRYYLLFMGLSLIVFFPFYFPYYELTQQWGLNRSIEESSHYSADLVLSYVNVPPLLNNFYQSIFSFAQSSLANHEKHLFLGAVLFSLVILGIWPTKRDETADQAWQIKWLFGLILASSFVLSLGPFLIWFDQKTQIRLPYWFFYHLLPGFSAMRVPARFGLMVTLAASVLAGLGFLRICAYLSKRAHFQNMGDRNLQLAVTVICAGFFMIELGFKPFPLARIQTGQEVPPVYRWLANQNPHDAIIELPFGHSEDYQYTYFSAYHWLPIVNGRTGFIPATYVQLMSELDALPAPSAFQALSAVGVKWLIVHRDRLRPDEALRWSQENFVDGELEMVAEFGTDIVYKIPPAQYTNQLQVEILIPDRLPIGKHLRLGMHAAGQGNELWAHPQPLGRTSVRVEWQELAAGKIYLSNQRMLLPLLIKPDRREQVGLSLRTPPSPGDYLVRVQLPEMGDSFAVKRVALTEDNFPTSQNSPHLLSASYLLRGAAPYQVTSAQFSSSLQVTNTGEAMWLSTAKADRGAVRLGWRWLKGEDEVPSTSGRETLQYDVFTGMSYVFEPKISTPEEPGEYNLEIGLVSEHVTWFHEQDIEPVKIPILLLKVQ